VNSNTRRSSPRLGWLGPLAMTAGLWLLATPAGAADITDELRLRGRLQARYGFSEDFIDGGWYDAIELPRARLDGRWRPEDWLELTLEVDLADGIEAKDVFGEVELHPLARFTVGNFKKPFSRLKLDSPWDLVIPERGLLDRFAISTNRCGGFGGRELGIMLSGKWDGAVGLRYFVGVFNNPLGEGTYNRDYVARLELHAIKGLTVAVHANHKLFREDLAEGGIGSGSARRTRNLFGGDVRWKLDAFVLQLEAAYGDNLGPGQDDSAATRVSNGEGHELVGAHAIASYRVELTDTFSLVPAFMAEVFDADLEQDGDTAVRLAGALNADLGESIRFSLSAEGLLQEAKGYDSPTRFYLQINLAY